MDFLFSAVSLHVHPLNSLCLWEWWGGRGERQNVRLCEVGVMGNSKKMLAFLLDSAAYGLPLFVTMPNLSFPHLGLFSLTLRG